MFIVFKVLLLLTYSLVLFIGSLTLLEILKQVRMFLVNIRNNYIQKEASENTIDTLSKIISYISLLKLTTPVLIVLQVILLIMGIF